MRTGRFSRLRRRAGSKPAKLVKVIAAGGDIEGAARSYMRARAEYRIALFSEIFDPVRQKRAA